MGIRQLQTFMQKSVPNGYAPVSLSDECESYFRQNQIRPILVVDMMGLMKPLIKCDKELLCGLRHDEMYGIVDNLFKNLSKICDIVFFEDGPVNNVKINEWIRRQNNQYDESLIIIDKIYSQCPLEEIVNSEKNKLPSVTSHLKLVEELAKMYGTVIVSYTKECDTEMAQYACRNSRVLAILADDSDFLIYPGEWRYFSIRDLDQNTLNTMEYSRSALKNYLGLNGEELVLLATLNGNDVINFDDTFRFHKSLIQQRNDPELRFKTIAKFIKESHILNSPNVYRDIAHLIYRQNSAALINRVHDSFKFYDINFQSAEVNDEVLRYCRENSYNYSFSILNNMPKNFSMHYIDLRESAKVSECVVTMFRKHAGILLRFRRFIGFEICIKMAHNDSFRTILVNPMVYKGTQPPILELLNRAQYPQHDKVRFDIIKWIINEQVLQTVDIQLIPKNILADILTLVYLVSERLISVIEADIILLSIKHVETNTVPEMNMPPYIMLPRAFIASFLFTKFNSHVGKSFQITGLNMLNKIINFNGVLFHNLYLKYVSEPFDLSILLGDLNKYRFYA